MVTGHLIACWRGVKEWGGASGSHKLPCSVAPPPRALAKDWWSVRAESCLPDPSVLPCQCFDSAFPCTHALVLLLTRLETVKLGL